MAIGVVAAGLTASTALALLSDGPYHDDSLTHFLYASWGWNKAHYLLDAWGRPGLTVLLFPLAPLGWTACRIEMALVTAMTAWLAYLIARRLGLRTAQWVPLFCYVQPLLLLMSYATMTETAMAFYLTLAIWLHLSGRPRLGATALSLCFVTRYEVTVLIAIWMGVLYRSRSHWLAYPILLWAPLLHNVLGAVVLERLPLWFVFESPQLAEYGRGTPLTMFTRSMVAWGPAIGLLAWGGCFRRWPGRDGWVVPASLVGYVAVHTTVYWFGTHGSGGYPRFLVGVSGLAAVSAAAGFQLLGGGGERPRPRAVLLLTGLTVAVLIGVELEGPPSDESWVLVLERAKFVVRAATVLVVALAIAWYAALRQPGHRRLPAAARIVALLAVFGSAVPLGVLVRPHRFGPEARAMRSAIEWLRREGLADRRVVATSTYASYFLRAGSSVVPPDSREILSQVEPGELFVWDAEYSPSARFGVSPDDLSESRGWRLLWPECESDDGDGYVRVFQRLSSSGRTGPGERGPVTETAFPETHSRSDLDDAEGKAESAGDDV